MTHQLSSHAHRSYTQHWQQLLTRQDMNFNISHKNRRCSQQAKMYKNQNGLQNKELCHEKVMQTE